MDYILKEKLNEYEDKLKTMNEQRDVLAIKINKLEKQKENRIKRNKFKKMCSKNFNIHFKFTFLN